MIFYNKLDNTQKSAISDDLDKNLSMQKAKLNILLECIEKTNSNIQNFNINLSTETNLKTFNQNFKLLIELQSSLDYSLYNISNLKKLKQILVSLPAVDYYSPKIEAYNKLALKCEKAIYLTNLCIDNIVSEYIQISELYSNNLPIQNNLLDTTPSDTLNKSVYTNINSTKTQITDKKILLISEIQNKVFLPYSIDELNEIFKKNKKYNSLQEIIDDKYTLPLDRYKNPFVSRFKEAYSLMRNRENASIIDSINLAVEVTFNSLLNPAIITACKNLDELDIYLDCLSSNELDKFDIFEIKYEIRPSKIIKPKRA